MKSNCFIIDAYRRSNGQLMVGFNRRFAPTTKAVLEVMGRLRVPFVVTIRWMPASFRRRAGFTIRPRGWPHRRRSLPLRGPRTGADRIASHQGARSDDPSALVVFDPGEQRRDQHADEQWKRREHHLHHLGRQRLSPRARRGLWRRGGVRDRELPHRVLQRGGRLRKVDARGAAWTAAIRKRSGS